MRVLTAFALVAALSLLPAHLHAAAAVAPRGVIEVVVVDAAGEPLPGAAVTLVPSSRADAQQRLEVTSSLGAASFRNLAQGTYSLRCELSGFFTTTLSEVPVELASESPRLPSPLRVVLTAGPIYY